MAQAKGKHKPASPTKKHAEAFDNAMEEALKDAADKWGNGSFEAQVSFEATVRITNPGVVGEYRVVFTR